MRSRLRFEHLAGFVVEAVDQLLDFFVDGLGGFLGVFAAAAEVA